MFWVRYVIIEIYERLRVATIINIISLETFTWIFERNLKFILVSTLKPNGLLIGDEIPFWMQIQLKVSLKILQHTMHLEEKNLAASDLGSVRGSYIQKKSLN